MATTKQLVFLAAATAIGLGTHAPAQTIQGGFELRVSNVVSPSQPTATVEVWAWFDNVPGVSEVFGGTNFDLTASEEGWLWSPWVFPLGSPGPGVTISGNSIVGLGAGQIHLPSVGLFGDPSNPIHLFSADWTTNDFTTRTVSVVTENTTLFAVYSQTGASTTLPSSGVVPGSGSIFVVPSPSLFTCATLSIAACTITRRRRA